MLVAVVDRTIYVKPMGYATQENSLGLPEFLKAMGRQGCAHVAFDLSDCRVMDSTFLGVIASAAMSGGQGRGKSVLILNAAPQAKHELQMIGLMPVVVLKKKRVSLPPEVELSEIDFVHMPGDERERLLRIKELHQHLVKLNERNRKSFGSFVQMLEEELRSS
jgi:anti-anti-sigma regulatory factor